MPTDQTPEPRPPKPHASWTPDPRFERDPAAAVHEKLHVCEACGATDTSLTLTPEGKRVCLIRCGRFGEASAPPREELDAACPPGTRMTPEIAASLGLPRVPPPDPAGAAGEELTDLERQAIMLCAGMDITSPHERVRNMAHALARYEETVRSLRARLAESETLLRRVKDWDRTAQVLPLPLIDDINAYLRGDQPAALTPKEPT